MVVQYSVGKKRLAGHDALHRLALIRLQALHHHALELADEDARAYGMLNELVRLQPDNPRRESEMPGAVTS